MRRKRRLKIGWNKKMADSSSSDEEPLVCGSSRSYLNPEGGSEEGGSSRSLPRSLTKTRDVSFVRDALKRQIFFQRAAQVLPKWAIESDLMTTFPTFHLISVASGSPVGVRRCSSDGQVPFDKLRMRRRSNRKQEVITDSDDSSTSEEGLVGEMGRGGGCRGNTPDIKAELSKILSPNRNVCGRRDEAALETTESSSSSSESSVTSTDSSNTVEGSDTVEERDENDDKNSNAEETESDEENKEQRLATAGQSDTVVRRRPMPEKRRRRKVISSNEAESNSNSKTIASHRKVVAQHSNHSTAMLLDLIQELESNMDGLSPGVVSHDPHFSSALGSRMSQSCDAFLATESGVCLNVARRRSKSRKLESRSMENVNFDSPAWRDKNSIGDLSELLTDITKMFNEKYGGKNRGGREGGQLPSDQESSDGEFWRYVDSLNMNPLKDPRFRMSDSARMFLSNPNLFTFAVSLSDLNAFESDPDLEDEKPVFQLGLDENEEDERIGLETPLEWLAGASDCLLLEGIIRPNMDSSTCLELALEGERLCKAGDCRAGVAFFEAAIQTGTDDLRTLSAIYSQLGNAYFYLGEYDKAMEYHKLDLTVARTMGDRLGVAKASGNLGNTLKVMGKFKEAICCCERHLTISQELEDKVGEGRALYNLGNVYHAQGKHLGRIGPQEPGGFSEEVKHCLQKAVEYYAANLRLMEELNDRSAQGRACGNLGNTHYLLGNFTQAISYHNERLAIAKEFGDKAAERRAHSNLGNAHIFLGEFETAADHYKKTLQLAQELGDRAVEAQACYSLGNTYTLLRDYPMAIHYHLRHLAIAQELADKVGEGRACWSLGNAYSATSNHEKALHYANRHLDISKEIGDKTGQAAAQMNLTDIRKALGLPPTPTDSESTDTAEDAKSRTRRKSMENMDLLKMTPDAKGVLRKYQSEDTAISSFSSDGSRPVNGPPFSISSPTDKNTSVNEEASMDEDSFFELLSRFQSKRMDDQRCTLSVDNNKENQPQPPQPQVPPPPHREAVSLSSTGSTNGTATPSDNGANNCGVLEELMESIAGMQSRRMDEQRASLPQLPGLNNQHAILQRLSVAANDSTSLPDDNFFDMLMRCQGSRIEDQRSFLPNEGAITHSAPTVPDDDFFSLIMRFQSGRLEDQRSTMPLEAGNNSIHPTSNTDEEEPPSNPQSVGGKDGLVSRLVKGRK